MDEDERKNFLEEKEEKMVLNILTPCTVVDDCPIPTDIVLVSSDGQRLATHTKNLAEFTGSFPSDIKLADGKREVPMVDLDGETLRIFLQYVHHHRQPDISSLDGEKLEKLTEAVERYEVYSATEVCRLHMLARLERKALEPLKVFKYAIKHGYKEVYDKSAEMMVADHYRGRFQIIALGEGSPFTEALAMYYAYWPNEFSIHRKPPDGPNMHKGGRPTCKKWKGFEASVLRETTGNDKCIPEMFSRFKGIIDDNKHRIEDCQYCVRRAERWSYEGSRSTLGFTKFSSFL